MHILIPDNTVSLSALYHFTALNRKSQEFFDLFFSVRYTVAAYAVFEMNF